MMNFADLVSMYQASLATIANYFNIKVADGLVLLLQTRC